MQYIYLGQIGPLLYGLSGVLRSLSSDTGLVPLRPGIGRGCSLCTGVCVLSVWEDDNDFCEEDDTEGVYDLEDELHKEDVTAMLEVVVVAMVVLVTAAMLAVVVVEVTFVILAVVAAGTFTDCGTLCCSECDTLTVLTAFGMTGCNVPL